MCQLIVIHEFIPSAFKTPCAEQGHMPKCTIAPQNLERETKNLKINEKNQGLFSPWILLD